jgi:hypothetical protein
VSITSYMVSFKPWPLYPRWLSGCQSRSGSLGEETFAGNRTPIPGPSGSSKSEGFPLSVPRKKQRNSGLFAVLRRAGFELTLRLDTCCMSQQLHVTEDTSELQVGLYKVQVHRPRAVCYVPVLAFVFGGGGGAAWTTEKRENGLRHRWPDFLTRLYILKTENILRSTNVSLLGPQGTGV